MERLSAARLRYTWMPLSQVYPIPPCSCMALPAMPTAALHVRFGHGGSGCHVTGVGGDGVDRRLDELAAHLDLHQHVGAGVFDGLERSDGPAELVAHLGVLDGRRQHRLGESEAVAGDRDRGAVPQRPGGVGADRQYVGDLDAGGGDDGQPPRLVEHRLRRHGGDRLDEDVAGEQQQAVGPYGVGHELGAPAHPPVLVREPVDDDRAADGARRGAGQELVTNPTGR